MGTKKVRLTRSIRLNGQHAEAGEIHELPLELADWLIAQSSAEALGVVARLVDRMQKGKQVMTEKLKEEPVKQQDSATRSNPKKIQQVSVVVIVPNNQKDRGQNE